MLLEVLPPAVVGGGTAELQPLPVEWIRERFRVVVDVTARGPTSVIRRGVVQEYGSRLLFGRPGRGGEIFARLVAAGLLASGRRCGCRGRRRLPRHSYNLNGVAFHRLDARYRSL